MGIQGVGSFLILALLVSVVAGALGVAYYNQVEAFQQQEANLQAAQDQLAQVNGKLMEYQTAFAALQTENQQGQMQIAALSQQVAQKQGDWEQGQILLQKALAERDQLQAALNEQSQTIATCASQTHTLEAQLASAQQNTAIRVTGLPGEQPEMVASALVVLIVFCLLCYTIYTYAQQRATSMIRVTPEEREAIIRYRRNRQHR